MEITRKAKNNPKRFFGNKVFWSSEARKRQKWRKWQVSLMQNHGLPKTELSQPWDALLGPESRWCTLLLHRYTTLNYGKLLGAEKYLPPPPREQEKKIFRGTLVPSTPTRKTISTIATLWPVKAISEKRAATVYSGGRYFGFPWITAKTVDLRYFGPKNFVGKHIVFRVLAKIGVPPKLRQAKGTQTQTFWSGYLRVGWGSSTWRGGGQKVRYVLRG